MFNSKFQVTSNFFKTERVHIKNCPPLVVCLSNYHTLIYLSIIIIFFSSFRKTCVQCLCTSFSLLSASTNNRAFFNVSLNQINNNIKTIFILNTFLLSFFVLMKKYCNIITSSKSPTSLAVQ